MINSAAPMCFAIAAYKVLTSTEAVYCYSSHSDLIYKRVATRINDVICQCVYNLIVYFNSGGQSI